MKLTMTEVRDLVAETIRRTLAEAKKSGKKPKEIPEQSDEAVAAQREKQTRATGYSRSDTLDYSPPLGTASLARQQGASGMGGWTKGSDPRPPAYGKIKVEHAQLRKLIEMIVTEEIFLAEGPFSSIFGKGKQQTAATPSAAPTTANDTLQWRENDGGYVAFLPKSGDGKFMVFKSQGDPRYGTEKSAPGAWKEQWVVVLIQGYAKPQQIMNRMGAKVFGNEKEAKEAAEFHLTTAVRK